MLFECFLKEESEKTKGGTGVGGGGDERWLTREKISALRPADAR